jgi:hypothetical protein
MINNRMEKKFIKLLESAISRYTRGGFLVGDYVEFVKNYKSLDAFKQLQDMMQETIDDLIKSGLRIRIIGVDDYIPVRFPGGAENSNGKVSVKIAADHGGGRHIYAITVCPSLLTVLDFYPNLAPFPDQFTKQNNEILQPKEVGEVDGGIKGGVYTLPTKNTVLKVAKSKKKKGDSYTANYL